MATSDRLITRNQEIFGQKLADYAVDCLWILVIVQACQPLEVISAENEKLL